MKYLKFILICLVFFITQSCITGGNMKTLIFPKQVKFHTINDKEAEKKYVRPKNLKFMVRDNPIIKGKKLIITSELINEGDNFNLIVHPRGGEFPYGGTNPFLVRVSSSSEDMITYIGPTFPPEPPLPMEIFVPAKSHIIFKGQIALDYYQWKGSPKILVDWYFCYYKEPFLEGTIEVNLPEK